MPLGLTGPDRSVLVKTVPFWYIIDMPGRHYTTLHDLAVEQYGYVTAADARRFGIDVHRLIRMVSSGLVERVGWGLYRFPDIPATAVDQLMEATLWPREQGVLSHDTALDLYELSDVNPAKIYVTVPKRLRLRRRQPVVYEIHRRDLPDADITVHENLRVVTPRRAIEDGISRQLGPELIAQAIATARRRGMITADDERDLEAMLGRPHPVRQAV
jgi:predicted transcriptional regulator of viral defense system